MFFKVFLELATHPLQKTTCSYHSKSNERIYKKIALKLDQYSKQDKIITNVNHAIHGNVNLKKIAPYDLCFHPKGVCFGLSLTYIQYAYYRSNFLFRSVLWDIEYGSICEDLKNTEKMKLMLDDLEKKDQKKNIIYSQIKSTSSKIGEVNQFINNVSLLQFSKKHISSIHSQNDDLVYELAKLSPPIISVTYMLLNSEIEKIFNPASRSSPFSIGACYLISLPRHASAISFRNNFEFYDPNHGLFQELKNIILTANSYYEYTDQYERIPISISLIKPLEYSGNLKVFIEKIKNSFEDWQKNTPSFDLELLQYNDDEQFLSESSIHKNNISFDYLISKNPSFHIKRSVIFSSISLIHIDNFKKIALDLLINDKTQSNLNTSLMELAIEKDRGDIVDYLLEKKANIFFSNKKNPTALHLAISEYHDEITEILLMKAPRDKIAYSLTIRNDQGASIFDLCLKNQRITLLDRLSKIYHEYYPGKRILFNKSLLNKRLINLIDHLKNNQETSTPKKN